MCVCVGACACACGCAIVCDQMRLTPLPPLSCRSRVSAVTPLSSVMITITGFPARKVLLLRHLYAQPRGLVEALLPRGQAAYLHTPPYGCWRTYMPAGRHAGTVPVGYTLVVVQQQQQQQRRWQRHVGEWPRLQLPEGSGEVSERVRDIE
eukprot:GHVU01070466.1.p1 GENE.GHVU01070466.1~~GHVU01070466.1.p1  ORF type:complete len:150 (+),score=10.98 GHVU01070466.1:209-658(+)